MLRRPLVAALVSAAIGGALGCGVKEDVSLFVYARGASLTKGENPFGATLDGAVDVVFDLGAYSGQPVTVEAIQLGLYRGGAQILPAARFEPPPGTRFPFDLAPGQKTTIRYTIRRDQLVDDEPATLCAGPVTVNGSVKQAGKSAFGLASEETTVAGCD